MKWDGEEMFSKHCTLCLFCMLTELWLEWVEDELPLVSTSIPEALQDLRELFERAVEDYLCEWTISTHPPTPLLSSTTSPTPHILSPISLHYFHSHLPHLTHFLTHLHTHPPHLLIHLHALFPSSPPHHLHTHLSPPHPSLSSTSLALTSTFSIHHPSHSPSSPSHFAAVHLWMLFAKFALEKFSAFPEGMEFPRDIFEKAIIACGLHVSSVSQQKCVILYNAIAGSTLCDLGVIVTRS